MGKKAYSKASKERWAKKSKEDRTRWGREQALKKWSKVDAEARRAHAMKMVGARKLKIKN